MKKLGGLRNGVGRVGQKPAFIRKSGRQEGTGHETGGQKKSKRQVTPVSKENIRWGKCSKKFET